MMRLEIKTEPTSDDGTFGKALLLGEDGDVVMGFDSLELPWRDNHPDYSCILPTPGSSAEYRCELRPTGKWTPRADGQLYLVLDTPGRSLVRIHAANWAGDVTKGKESQLEGCIALGVGRGIGVPPDHPETQPMIVSSRVALERFMQATQGLPITLAITRG